jgi:hypothetical protein
LERRSDGIVGCVSRHYAVIRDRSIVDDGGLIDPMPIAFRDLVKDTWTGTGTGAITPVGSPPTGFRAFTVFTSGDELYLRIEGGAEWEVSKCTWNGTTLTRDTVLVSSNANALVNFSAGTKTITNCMPASGIGKFEEQTADPAAPTTGLVTWSKAMAGKRIPYVRGPNEAWPLGPHLGRQRVGRWNPIGNANTAPIANGIAAPSVTGTATQRLVAITNMATAARRLGYVSAATAGSLAGARSGAAQYWRGNAAGLGGFVFICRFVMSDAATVSGARAFVGLSASLVAPTNVEPNTVNNSVGVAQISTSTNLQIVTRDGAAAQTIDLGANFPANTLSADLYELMLYAPPNGTTIGYRVERLNTGHVAEGTLSSNLPVSTTLMGPTLWRCNNATALAVGIDLVQLYIETDY